MAIVVKDKQVFKDGINLGSLDDAKSNYPELSDEITSANSAENARIAKMIEDAIAFNLTAPKPE